MGFPWLMQALRQKKHLPEMKPCPAQASSTGPVLKQLHLQTFQCCQDFKIFQRKGSEGLVGSHLPLAGKEKTFF